MKLKTILLPTIEHAKALVSAAGRCDFDIDVFNNHITIDAKSIMGVLSLDLSRELTVRMYGEDDELEAFLDHCSVNQCVA